MSVGGRDAVCCVSLGINKIVEFFVPCLLLACFVDSHKLLMQSPYQLQVLWMCDTHILIFSVEFRKDVRSSMCSQRVFVEELA